MPTETELRELAAKVRSNCNGHPNAEIPWPHRILHEAADALEKAADDVAEQDAAFDLHWKADMRGIKLWQAAGEGRELTWPDHAYLVSWLLERIDALEAENARLRAVANAAKEVCLRPEEVALSSRHVPNFGARMSNLRSAMSTLTPTEPDHAHP